MDTSFSLCTSIGPRVMAVGGGSKTKDSGAEFHSECEDSISNGESFSTSSIANSEMLRCNARIGRGS